MRALYRSGLRVTRSIRSLFWQLGTGSVSSMRSGHVCCGSRTCCLCALPKVTELVQSPHSCCWQGNASNIPRAGIVRAVWRVDVPERRRQCSLQCVPVWRIRQRDRSSRLLQLSFWPLQHGRCISVHCMPGTLWHLIVCFSICAIQPGRFASGEGQSECSPCANRQIAPLSGASICLVCPGETQAQSGVLCTCGAGTFSATRTSADVACVKCPQGAKCDEPGVREDQLTAETGWCVVPPSRRLL